MHCLSPRHFFGACSVAQKHDLKHSHSQFFPQHSHKQGLHRLYPGEGMAERFASADNIGKPNSSLAEWTSKIRTLQNMVDEDAAKERTQLELEIEKSRGERSHKKAQPGQGNFAFRHATEVDSEGNLVHVPSHRSPPTSLAEFIGGRAPGPRLNKHKPQQNVDDPAAFDLRPYADGGSPLFQVALGMIKERNTHGPPGGVRLPGMTPEFQAGQNREASPPDRADLSGLNPPVHKEDEHSASMSSLRELSVTANPLPVHDSSPPTPMQSTNLNLLSPTSEYEGLEKALTSNPTRLQGRGFVGERVKVSNTSSIVIPVSPVLPTECGLASPRSPPGPLVRDKSVLNRWPPAANISGERGLVEHRPQSSRGHELSDQSHSSNNSDRARASGIISMGATQEPGLSLNDGDRPTLVYKGMETSRPSSVGPSADKAFSGSRFPQGSSSLTHVTKNRARKPPSKSGTSATNDSEVAGTTYLSPVTAPEASMHSKPLVEESIIGSTGRVVDTRDGQVITMKETSASASVPRDRDADSDGNKSHPPVSSGTRALPGLVQSSTTKLVRLGMSQDSAVAPRASGPRASVRESWGGQLQSESELKSVVSISPQELTAVTIRKEVATPTILRSAEAQSPPPNPPSPPTTISRKGRAVISEKTKSDPVPQVDESLPVVDVRSILQSAAVKPPLSFDLAYTPISTEVFVIRGRNADSVSSYPHIFYDTELRVILYRCKEPRSSELASTVIWVWRGRNAAMGGEEEWKIRDLESRFGTKAIRCNQGGEPYDLVGLLGGVVAIRRGTQGNWTNVNATMHCVRELSFGIGIVIDEVDLNISNLCSAFSYVIGALGQIYVWHGRGSLPTEQSQAVSYAALMSRDNLPVKEFNEGREDSKFWTYLGNGSWANARFWSERRELQKRTPSAWSVAFPRIHFVPFFGNQHLDHGTVYVVDGILELFVIVGKDARSQRNDIRLALALAEGISSVTASERPFEAPVHVVVLPSQLPLDLRVGHTRFLDETLVNGGTSPGHLNLLHLKSAKAQVSGSH
ncbi:uncharacterized protein EI90DRAFT_1304399 [Cantharellus anzutake]|uniref:uncharacterized protein n=1 Tax=Cantharellus anzutake TaxID=1750568 RepID=UPI001907E56C|nr:uncharacterized protein EI90DRAFT_1304399 [Cantharellus anzutake]KAF8342133.1 hypothetical protein EI90DRAFT_1304399 [Cantharellus anzutake]